VKIEIKQEIKRVNDVGDDVYLAGKTTAFIDGKPVPVNVAQHLLASALEKGGSVPDETVKVGTVQPPEEPTRFITDHKVTRLNERIDIMAMGPRTTGNAQAHYEIVADRETENPRVLADLDFQARPLSDAEKVDLTNEALLAVVLDRLRSFQEGEFKCRENALAITKLEEAMHWIESRAKDRRSRGVEGTYEK
jgi:hypothetical protein